eukprot:gnl/Spiro4/7429_TR3892_c0_g1_i1.p1 gnl/Spiro4/7429_TR3892_c0_g1~~gnl/Spiro4/7429_TR3892_c0_g1_i1.p1  ORF type:complete len:971 (+),score=282.40 gnl/Spiro4/7429_TR3892_c0_g1_i1:264-2915(+)
MSLPTGGPCFEYIRKAPLECDGFKQFAYPSKPVHQRAEFTVAFWFVYYNTFNGNWRNIIHKGNQNWDRTVSLWLRPWDNNLHCCMSDGHGTNRCIVMSEHDVKVGVWTHIAIVLDSKSLRLYINGNIDSVMYLDAGVTTNNGPWWLCGDPWHWNLRGLISSVVFYAVGLETEEVMQVYEKGRESPNWKWIQQSPVKCSASSATTTALVVPAVDNSFQHHMYTLSFWITLDSPRNSRWQSVAFQGTGNYKPWWYWWYRYWYTIDTGGLSIWIHPYYNRLYARVNLDGWWWWWSSSLISSQDLPLKTKTFVAYTMDSNDFKLYINGRLDASVPMYGRGVRINNDGFEVCSRNWWYSGFSGSIEQLRFTDIPLQAPEIASLMAVSVSRYAPPPQPELVCGEMRGMVFRPADRTSLIIDFGAASKSSTGFPSRAFTLTFWIKTNQKTPGAIVSYATATQTDGVLLTFPSAPHLVIGGKSPATGWRTLGISDNRWHHVAIVFTQNPLVADNLYYYVDGQMVFPPPPAFGTLPTDLLDYNGVLVFGQKQTGRGGPYDPQSAFDGFLDEVALFDDALPADKIQKIVADGVLPADDWAFNLVSFWSFDEASEYTAPDTFERHHGHVQTVAANSVFQKSDAPAKEALVRAQRTAEAMRRKKVKDFEASVGKGGEADVEVAAEQCRMKAAHEAALRAQETALRAKRDAEEKARLAREKEQKDAELRRAAEVAAKLAREAALAQRLAAMQDMQQWYSSEQQDLSVADKQHNMQKADPSLVGPYKTAYQQMRRLQYQKGRANKRVPDSPDFKNMTNAEMESWLTANSFKQDVLTELQGFTGRNLLDLSLEQYQKALGLQGVRLYGLIHDDGAAATNSTGNTTNTPASSTSAALTR